MPIYEYQCKKCGKIFEAFQRTDEKPIRNCQFCSGKVERILSPAGFILKGSGFYINDYPSESRKKGLESEKSKTETRSKDKEKKSSKEALAS